MMVANSFDLWQKDAFFSAAEEVQESADVMQSAYRMWIREKKEGSNPEYLDELSRDLQTALGTAKWQLEEFERAVRLSHGHRSDDIAASRHKQFVAAIESQIADVEAALREAFSEEGKQPLQWVTLNKEECDDLALFLSGTPQNPQIGKDKSTEHRLVECPLMEIRHMRKDVEHNLNATCSAGSYNEKDVNDVVTINKHDEFIIDLEGRETSRMKDDIICQSDKTIGARRTWGSPNVDALKIVIAEESEHRNGSMPRIEATPKEKGSKRLFWKPRSGEYSRAKGSSYMFNQLFGQVGGFQRQASSNLQFSCSVQLTLALMLSIFLIVPFLLYSA
ncbi:uncharacterized protein LOC110599859 [Manihot esculenta]|uniref:Syntaxin 6/10/61 N-terminal domain-containing protein n=2 Tax=Manihot esculenta TaxID=3983 RepID=A0A2C9ULK2_MANES|nr:uncharacterized protein LOC110599859 [Manihot esculenta]KAG8639533.1 hypothetical protein MANES_14G153000v8 [Manihot esculenta]OAY31934.1 hypothetical protein MANES_14G153000v8 [Manihot esculenta]